jgi:uncharacterized membrane protein
METTKRSILKTVSWRVIGTAAVLIISLVVTGSFALAGSIAVTQFITNTILYFFHERIWNKITWGVDPK